jgi:hypothetical protein
MDQLGMRTSAWTSVHQKCLGHNLQPEKCARSSSIPCLPLQRGIPDCIRRPESLLAPKSLWVEFKKGEGICVVGERREVTIVGIFRSRIDQVRNGGGRQRQ